LQERLKDSFLEDARENLSSAEAQLLALTDGVRDPEVIAALFRAIHSIKGSAGSFGFQVVTETAHGMETCLDELRSNRRQVTPALIEVMLTGVDLLKRLIESPDAPLDASRAQLAAALASLDVMPDAAPWELRFTPSRRAAHGWARPAQALFGASRAGANDGEGRRLKGAATREPRPVPFVCVVGDHPPG
jgi:chemotaxis protein histidine kinase CheA